MRILLLLMHLLPITCSALTLRESWEFAKAHDPAFLSAKYAKQASDTQSDAGRALLLPQISGSARALSTNQNIEQDTLLGTRQQITSNDTQSATLTLRQPLFDMGRFAGFKLGSARTEQGEWQYIVAEQQLFARVAEAYFDALLQSVSIRLNQAQRAAVASLVAQNQRRFEAGDAAITDIQEAEARRDLLDADLIELQARKQVSYRRLELMIGRAVDSLPEAGPSTPDEIGMLNGRDLKAWLQKAESNSPTLKTKESAIKIAEATLDQQKAGNYPTLSLVGQLGINKEKNKHSEQRGDTNLAGILVDIPIFQGGATLAATDRSRAELMMSFADFDSSRQNIAYEVERNYLGVNSGITKFKAQLTAVTSSKLALHSAQQGFKAGLRSTEDILNAEERLYAATRDLLITKGAIFLSKIRLLTNTGEMTPELLEQIQSQIE